MYVMLLSMGVLCCPFVECLCVVTVCLGMSPWCPRGSLSVVWVSVYSGLYFVAGVGLCEALPFPCDGVHLCRGPACLCVPSAARRPCVFVCDVYVSPSADGCPPLYEMCLSMRVSATCVRRVQAACACLTSASRRGAHVSMLVACHSSVRGQALWALRPPTRVCWSLSVPPPPLPPGSQCYWGASCHDDAPSSLHPPSSHPSSDRLSAPPILAALGGGALILPPPPTLSPPTPATPAPQLLSSVRLSIPSSVCPFKEGEGGT